jgi:hypothetical protein
MEMLRFSSNSWFARVRGGYKKEKGEKNSVNEQFSERACFNVIDSRFCLIKKIFVFF